MINDAKNNIIAGGRWRRVPANWTFANQLLVEQICYHLVIWFNCQTRNHTSPTSYINGCALCVCVCGCVCVCVCDMIESLVLEFSTGYTWLLIDKWCVSPISSLSLSLSLGFFFTFVWQKSNGCKWHRNPTINSKIKIIIFRFHQTETHRIRALKFCCCDISYSIDPIQKIGS